MTEREALVILSDQNMALAQKLLPQIGKEFAIRITNNCRKVSYEMLKVTPLVDAIGKDDGAGPETRVPVDAI